MRACHSHEYKVTALHLLALTPSEELDQLWTYTGEPFLFCLWCWEPQSCHCFHFCGKAQKSIWLNLSWADSLLFVAFSQITYSVYLTVACDSQQVEWKGMTCIPGNLVTHPQWAILRTLKHWACVNKGPGEAGSTGTSSQVQLSLCLLSRFQSITWFLSECWFAGLNPKSWSYFKPGFSLFLCLRNKPAVITLVWNVAERKKGKKHCVIFCYFWFLRSFWSLQILCNYHFSWNIFLSF